MFVIYGPPGTGKTTTLLDMVEKSIEKGTPPGQIAFLAFTRKAAREARERAASRFNLDTEHDLYFFRTLHSFCYNLSDIKRDQLLASEHLVELGNTIGFNLRASSVSEEDDIGAAARDNPMMQLIQLSRLKKEVIDETYRHSGIEEPLTTVKYIDECYRKYKRANRLYDYTDILEWFSQNGSRVCPRFDVTFLDEAQDLSPLQWEIAHVLNEKSRRMYAAGDDDQAIYRWAGADVEHFLNVEEGSEVLSQSYRVPRTVHKVAQRIANRITVRRPKHYNPKPEEGTVHHIFEPDIEKFKKGDWMIMAQCNYMLNEVCESLKQHGFYFENRGYRSISLKLAIALDTWKSLVKGEEVTANAVKDLYYFMKSITRIKRGFKNLPNTQADDMFTLASLQENMGLLATKDMTWDVAMDKISEDNKTYIAALLRRGEDLNRAPRIKVSTIHGTKGGEATNVVLYTYISNASDQSISSDTREGRRMLDDLHRLFYVGVTRSKQNLFIVSPMDGIRSYQI